MKRSAQRDKSLVCGHLKVCAPTGCPDGISSGAMHSLRRPHPMAHNIVAQAAQGVAHNPTASAASECHATIASKFAPVGGGPGVTVASGC